MRSTFPVGALVAALLAASTAQAQVTLPIGPDAPASSAPASAPFVANGGTAALSPAARAGQSLYVTDFAGVKCDGVNDDTTGINAALAALRAAGQGTLNFPAAGPSNNKCMVTGPLNFTGLASLNYAIQGNGAVIHGTYATTGPAGTLGTITGGSSYTAGTYNNVPLTGGTGTACTASSVTVTAGAVTAVVLPPGGCGSAYTPTDTLSAAAANIGGTGAGFSVPVASVSGGAIIDATGSRFIRWNNFTVEGDCTTPPNIGIQIGRITSVGSADDHIFSGVYATGCYSLAAVLNNASETVQFNHLLAWNSKTTGNTFGLIQDGANHWNASSSFVSITAGVDTAESFNENVFISLDARTNLNVNAVPIWITTASRHRFIASYVASGGVGCVIYAANGTMNSNTLYMDVHFEIASMTDVFLFSGAFAAPNLPDLTYIDHYSDPTNSVFKLDTGVTSGALKNLDVEITYFPNANVKLFDNAALWTVSARRIELPALVNWTLPGVMNGGGEICIAASCVNLVPTMALNRNPEFVLDQLSEGAAITANSLVADGWRYLNTGVVSFTSQVATASPPPGSANYLSETLVGTVNPSAAQQWHVRSMIEGAVIAPLQWGTASAQPVTLDFCLNVNNIGTYSASLANNGASRSYVLNVVVTQANVWQCFSNIIPGDTSGGWSNTPNAIGMFIRIAFGAGSNFVASPNAWGAGNFLVTSSTINFTNISGATIKIGNVHLRPGQIDMPYLPRPFSDELTLAQRFFQKTFKLGLAPAQNAGALGAVDFSSPYAQAIFASVVSPVRFARPIYNNNGSTYPTMTFYSTGAATGNCYDVTKAADAGAASALNLNDQGFGLQCTLAVGDALGDQLAVHYTADSGF